MSGFQTCFCCSHHCSGQVASALPQLKRTVQLYFRHPRCRLDFPAKEALKYHITMVEVVKSQPSAARNENSLMSEVRYHGLNPYWKGHPRERFASG